MCVPLETSVPPHTARHKAGTQGTLPQLGREMSWPPAQPGHPLSYPLACFTLHNFSTRLSSPASPQPLQLTAECRGAGQAIQLTWPATQFLPLHCWLSVLAAVSPTPSFEGTLPRQGRMAPAVGESMWISVTHRTRAQFHL